MELYQLQTFIIVAEEGNITRAARRLYTTPSTISMHVRALEDELGIQLFTRSNQGVTITPKGEIILEKARATVRSAQDLVNHATDMQSALVGQVTVGLCSDPPLLQIPQLVRQIRADYPGIDLLLDKSTSAQITEAVSARQLDLGFVYGAVTHPALEARHLARVELAVAVPSAWLGASDLADWHTLAAQPWVSVGAACPFQALLDEHLRTQGLTPGHRVQIDDERSRYALVTAGIGLSLLERCTADMGVAEGVMHIAPVAPLHIDLSLVCRPHERHQPLVRCAIELITALFAEPHRAVSPAKNSSQ